MRNQALTVAVAATLALAVPAAASATTKCATARFGPGNLSISGPTVRYGRTGHEANRCTVAVVVSSAFYNTSYASHRVFTGKFYFGWWNCRDTRLNANGDLRVLCTQHKTSVRFTIFNPEG